MDNLIDEGCEPPASVRNGTDLSRLCDRLIRGFLASGAEHATVRVARTGYGLDALYKGLWNSSCKSAWRGKVAVHRQDKDLYLIRKGK